MFDLVADTWLEHEGSGLPVQRATQHLEPRPDCVRGRRFCGTDVTSVRMFAKARVLRLIQRAGRQPDQQFFDIAAAH
jgi:hypothetical protein